MALDSIKGAKHASVYEGILLVLALLCGSGIFKGNIASVVASLCASGFFVCYGVKFSYFSKQDTAIRYACVKRYLAPFFVVSIMLCVAEAYKSVFRPELPNGLIDSLSDTTTLYGYGPVGLFSALFIGCYLYGVIRDKCKAGVTLGTVAGAFVVLYYFYNRSFSFTAVTNATAYYIYRVAMAFIYRGLVALVLIGIGECLERYLIKLDKLGKQIHRLVLSGLGVLFIICGYLVSTYNTSIDLLYMQLGNAYIFMIAVILMSTGLFLICRWIGEGAVLEYIGANFVVLYAVGNCLLGSYLSRRVSARVFEYTNHNFVRNFSAVVTMCVVEAAAILLCRLYGKIKRG